MVHTQLADVLCHLRHVAGARDGGPTDVELLGRYVASHDAAAFELLVWRHGAMVLQTCRRMLSRPEDAEDAFQATFLALVQRARTIGRREAVAGWLHTVACRAALRARAAAQRRTTVEQQVLSMHSNGQHPTAAACDGLDLAAWSEVRELIDREVARLPVKLRDAFVLCCLEGFTNEEAAQRLGCPKGTVLSRLARARERLRGRLVGRGLGVTAAVISGALAQEAAACLAPAPLVSSIVKAATLVAAGQATASVVSAPVAALTKGVLQAMFLSKIKFALVSIVTLGMVAVGSGGLWHVATAQPAAQKGQPAQAPTSGKPDADRKAQIEAAEARVRRFEATIRAVELQNRLHNLEIKAAQARSTYEAARVELELARIDVEKFNREFENAKPPIKIEPGKAAEPPASPAPNTPAVQAPERSSAAPLSSSTDLIHLATTFVDAHRDLQTAKVHYAHASELAARAAGSKAERDVAQINMQAAERKIELLRAIIESTLRGAEEELAWARRNHQAGFVSPSAVASAQAKIDVLQLILKSAK